MVHWLHARAVGNDNPFPASAVIAEKRVTRQSYTNDQRTTRKDNRKRSANAPFRLAALLNRKQHALPKPIA